MASLLVIDDDLSVRVSLEGFFEDREYDILTAGSGEEGIEIVKQNRIDAAIVDLRLPGMDGTAFVRELKKTGIKTVVVFCTGSADFRLPEDIKTMSNVSHNVFLKPLFNMEEIENEVRLMIRKNREE